MLYWECCGQRYDAGLASMWRDPLDELVEDLERLAPAPRPTLDYHEQLLNLQRFTDAILYGSDNEVEALKADPAYQQWLSRIRAARGGSE
jgi:hypothetical protein